MGTITEFPVNTHDVTLTAAQMDAALTAAAELKVVKAKGAAGTGIADDTTALQNAFEPVYGTSTTTKVLNLGNDKDAIYLVSDTIIDSDSISVIIKGEGTIKRADSWVVNVDGNANNFDPIIRIKGAPSVSLEGGWKVDGNRAGQTYPATDTVIGRGSLPFRHNGDIEICPSADNTTPSRDININFGGCENSYLNGLVLWQCENVTVTKTNFKNTTWNGISGAGAREVNISGGNYFYRCGASDDFDTNQNQGDRAGIQFREFPIGKTQATEGIPCIVTGEFVNGGINEGISVVNNDFVECGVQSVYIRAGFSTIVNSNMSKNCGYKRLDDTGRYYPAHVWLENGQYTANGNKIYQTQLLAGDMRPTGMRITSLVGDATGIFPANGIYYSQVNGNMIVSSKDETTGVSDGFFNYGIRTNGHGDYSHNTVDGTQDYSMWVQNDDSFTGDLPPSFFKANSCTLVNSDMGGNSNTAAIHITRFGSPVGDVEDIHADCVTLNQALAVIEFNTNLNTYDKINISYGTGNIFSRYSEVGPITLSSALKRQDNHGLGGFPKLVTGTIKCLANNGGWQTGDELDVSYLITTGNNQGMAISADATKTTLLVGSDANPFKLPNRAGGSEGNTVSLDLTKWELYIKCFI